MLYFAIPHINACARWQFKQLYRVHATRHGACCGAVVVVKLASQMEAAVQNSRPVSPIIFSADVAGDTTKLVSVAWIPTSRGCTFLAAHASGAVFVYPKVSALPWLRAWE